MISVLILVDEEKNIENLSFLLENDCEGVQVIAKFNNAKSVRQWLLSNSCDVIFLDINMPIENGFEFLKNIQIQNLKIVFVTAYNEFALQAIKANAFDYILKPINIDELQASIKKLKSSLVNFQSPLIQQEQLTNLLNSFQQKSSPKKNCFTSIRRY